MSKRTILEPMGRWSTLVIVAHVAAGFALWWWLAHEVEVAGSPGSGSDTVWMSPADFAAPQAAVVSEAAQTEPVAVALPKAATPAAATPTPSAPAAAVAPVEKPVPKAIAIPANATAEDIAKLLARTPSRLPSIPPPPRVAPSETAPPQPMPSVAAAAAPAVVNPLPPPPLEVSRTITVQHREASSPAAPPAAPPAGASLSDIAAYEAAGAGTTGSTKGINMDDMDRAIMKAFTQNWVVKAEFAQLPPEQRTAHMDIAVGRDGQVLTFKMAKSSNNRAFDESVLAAGNRVENVQARLPPAFTGNRYEFQLNFHAE